MLTGSMLSHEDRLKLLEAVNEHENVLSRLDTNLGDYEFRFDAPFVSFGCRAWIESELHAIRNGSHETVGVEELN